MPNDRAGRIPDSLIAGAALLGLAGIVVYVASGPSSWLSLAALALGAGTAGVILARACGLVPVPCQAAARPHEARPPAVVVILAIGTTVLTARAADDTWRGAGSDGHVARLWITSIALLLLAAWWPSRTRGRWQRPAWRGAPPWLGVVAIAALPRIVMLDRFPTVLTGDEGSFMMTARAAQRGELAGVFGPGFFGNPNLYPAVSGYVAGMIGSPPADYRIFSALVGTLGVVATWRLGRHLFGTVPAASGAVILATMPLNLYFSRNALNNISDATVLAGALLFLLRASTGHRRMDAVLCGVTLGLGAYGYFGGRVLPGVLLASLAVLLLGRRVPARQALVTAGWMAAGFAVTAMPLIIAFRAIPDEFMGRLDQVSPFGWEALTADFPGTGARYLDNARDGALAPWIGTPGDVVGFFMRQPPLLGWPMAILLAIGAAACVARVIRDRDVPVLACIVTPAALLTGGVALTVPIAAQRLVALTPLWALVAGLGLAVVARSVSSLARPIAWRRAGVVVAVVLAAMTVTDLRWLASEERQIETYGDYRGLMMWDIGWRVANAPDGTGEAPAVLFAGPPFVFAGGFNSLVIQAPELAMRDVVEPLGTAPAPSLPTGSMLVIVPERQAERCEAERLYPHAAVAEARDRRGTLLYIALFPQALSGWSVAETPAETTFSMVADSPCD